MTQTTHYDLIIIGAGPGGYIAAERAGVAGMKTLLIEKAHIGGVCLNEGCVPSKTLLHSAKTYYNALNSEPFGITCENVSYKPEIVKERKDGIIAALRKGIALTVKKCNAEYIEGEATITGKGENGFEVKTKEAAFTSEKLLLATGSSAIRFNIPGATLKHVLTNKEILDLDTVPESIVIIGGGIIGLEFASYFASIGSKVTVVEMMPSIGGPAMDKDISKGMLTALKKKKVKVYTSASVSEITQDEVKLTHKEKEIAVPAKTVMLSVGRSANVKNIGLENIGIAIENGKVLTDEYLRTNVDGVWAVGDINGKVPLAHTASREAEVAVHNMCGVDDVMRYDNIPWVVYSSPEVASVGITEDAALKKGLDIQTAKIPMGFNGRFQAEHFRGNGFTQVIVDAKTKRLLGVHIIGAVCSEMIAGATTMIENEMCINDITKAVFPHPTVSETIRDALLTFENHCE